MKARVVRSGAYAVIWGLAALVLALPGWSAPRELDGIVAIVEDDVVLASELLGRLKTVRESIRASNVQAPPDDVLISQLMERLIVESLQLQQAERRGVKIDDETLTAAVGRFAEQNNMTIDEFRRALAADGMSYREFREEIRKEMIISRLQRNVVNRRISITDKDINDLLNSPYYQGLLSDEYRVGHILLTVAANAPESARAQAMQQAREIVAQLRDGAEFRQMAISRSSGQRALEGGDLGWRKAGELPSLFAETVIDLKVGETAEPIRSASGVHVIQLLDKRGAGTQREVQTKLRHVLVQPSEIRTEAETEALIQSLHEQLVAGADFAEIAREHSEDPGSALNGGDLGWTSGDEFVPAFAEVMRATPTGAISEPFRTQYGWHVIEVLDRREQDMSEEARRNMALKILHERRFEEALQEWLKEIRDEAFVEVRL